MKLFVPAHNCCPVAECHTACTVLGHPTVYGWMLIIGTVALCMAIAIFVNAYMEGRKA